MTKFYPYIPEVNPFSQKAVAKAELRARLHDQLIEISGDTRNCRQQH